MTDTEFSVLIDCTIFESANKNIAELKKFIPEENIFCAGQTASKFINSISDTGITSGRTLKLALNKCKTKYLLLCLGTEELSLTPQTLSTISKHAQASQAGLIYSSYQIDEQSQPLIPYQTGSVRDNFNFGPLVTLDVSLAKQVLETYPELIQDDYTAWYGLRLAISLEAPIFWLNEEIYSAKTHQVTDQEEEHFSYVNPANLDYQKALENVFTTYAKLAGFFLEEVTTLEDFSNQDFNFEASVVIPVKNRVKTIQDAVKSACSQKCNFNFNVIVVDNHSDDGTTALLQELSKTFTNLVHIIPDSQDLGIGGCWNEAIQSKQCGRFAVQLDSDDLYKNEKVLQIIVDCFHRNKSAAVVGSYQLVDEKLNNLPPGLIAHKEWTDSNGHNNGLRINGFGAPRAFFTPVARSITFPNSSYGEDYAMMLAITRTHKLARIFDSLYLCRRWSGNSDASLSIEKENRFNLYKDGLRTKEIEERMNCRGNC